MLSSIHPLGERGRGNRWGLTVGALVVGAVGAGALVGGMLGGIGARLGLGGGSGSWIVAGSALVAAALDWRRIAPPGPKRQVNERWIGAYRGWVYGVSFGAQLGAGTATYVVTWLVYVTAIAALVSGSPLAGVVIGGVFGTVRAIPIVAARWIDRPSRLGIFHKRMATLGPPMRRATTVTAAVAAFAAVGAML